MPTGPIISSVHGFSSNGSNSIWPAAVLWTCTSFAIVHRLSFVVFFFFSDELNSLANHLRRCTPTGEDIHGVVQRLWLYTEYYLVKFQIYYSKLTNDVR